MVRIFSDIHRDRLSEHRKKQVPPMTGKQHSDETKQKIRLSNKKTCGSIFARRRRSQFATNQWSTINEDDRNMINQKIVEGNIGGFWYGNVRYYDVKYCDKFNGEFRERCRAFQKYRCSLCGHLWIQGEKKLAVHHVHAKKDSCCNETSSKYFVCLCSSTCHGKTIGKERLYAPRFVRYILKNFGGRCFFMKSEMDTKRNK
jgi:hypothetical protein